MAVFLLLMALAAAEDAPLSVLGRFELDCPLCREPFTTVVCTQSNTRGGVDRDLFARALGAQPEFYRISTCPRCGYSGYEPDFSPAVRLPPDVREKILKAPKLKLPKGFTAESDPRELDAADRYALAITCYTWRSKSDEALAWLHLRASWIAREEGSSLPQDGRLARVMAFIERWRPAPAAGGNQLDVEMQLASRVAEAIAAGQFNRYQRPYVELALALILRRHGENPSAARLLDPLLKSDHFQEPLLEAMRRMRASIENERKHQRAAADAFERALLADSITPENRGPARYLLAELYRRLGHDAEARAWYDRALADASLPPHLRAWALEQRSALRQ